MTPDEIAEDRRVIASATTASRLATLPIPDRDVAFFVAARVRWTAALDALEIAIEAFERIRGLHPAQEVEGPGYAREALERIRGR